jgi:NAD+ kinase
VTDIHGKEHTALAINEVSMLRQTRQAANLRIKIDNNVRIKELTCDGVLLSTPAGSTAYNLSVGGPILPLTSDILALTPISPFRPRRWKGALINHKAVVVIEILDCDKRPVSAVADFTEIRDVAKVEIRESRQSSIRLLFDHGHSLEDRIISEQFQV